MTSKLTSAEIFRIGIQEDADSIPVDDDIQSLKNKINELVDEIANLTTPPVGSEVPNSRPYHTVLKNRLDSIWSGQANYIKFGGAVTISSTGNQADVTEGEAKIAGIDVVWTIQTSGIISFTGANTRFDVVVINSDSTLQIVTGTQAANPVLPSIAATQKALWVLTVTTTTVTASWDARDQGCWYRDEGRLKFNWYIQNAIDDIISGDIWIGKGIYYENLTYKTSVNLIFEGGAIVYNASGVKQGDVDNTKILGEIIAIHPDVKAAFLPNDYEYAPCDGVADLPTTVFDTGNDTQVPDLTDDRFLMGDTAYGTGGSNTADHTHQWGYYNHSTVQYETLITSNFAIRTFTTPNTVFLFAAANPGGGTGGQQRMDPIGSFSLFTGGGINNASNPADNRPKYFSVKYYIRIR